MTDDGLVDEKGNFCYRHPNRQSYILCQRCGRTVCPSCSTQASVGVHCPECVKEAQARAPRQRPAAVRAARAWRRGSNVPVVTYSIIALCLIVYALQFFVGIDPSFYAPALDERPQSIVTSIFAHGGVIHLLLNMFSLFMIGPTLELAVGRVRYATLYLLAGVAGNIAYLWLADIPTLLSTSVVGASGAVFGLLGALFVMIRRIGGNTSQLIIVLMLNLGLGFLVPGIAWQAHIGGLVAGLIIAVIYTRTQGPRNRSRQIALIAAVGAALVALTVAAVFIR